MSKTTLIYIALIVILCGGSFWLGTMQRDEVESTETTVRIDTVFVDNPAAPVSIEAKGIITADVPVANYDELKTQILDSLISIGYILKDIEDIVDAALPKNIVGELPIDQYIFKEEGVFDIGMTGYNPTLDYVKLYNTNTTTTKVLGQKHWAVFTGVNSLTCLGVTNLYLGVGVSYQKGLWHIEGSYNINANGNSTIGFGVRRKIIEF